MPLGYAYLGKVMLKLDHGEELLRTTRFFHMYKDGARAEVLLQDAQSHRHRYLRQSGRVFLADCMLQRDQDMDYMARKPFDDIGRDCRVGLKYQASSMAMACASTVGCYARGLSAVC